MNQKEFFIFQNLFCLYGPQLNCLIQFYCSHQPLFSSNSSRQQLLRSLTTLYTTYSEHNKKQTHLESSWWMQITCSTLDIHLSAGHTHGSNLTLILLYVKLIAFTFFYLNKQNRSQFLPLFILNITLLHYFLVLFNYVYFLLLFLLKLSI